MYPRVLRQVAGVGERLGALGALVGFRLAHMYLGVQLQVRLGREDLKKQRGDRCVTITCIASGFIIIVSVVSSVDAIRSVVVGGAGGL